jgi:hypothetical protein
MVGREPQGAARETFTQLNSFGGVMKAALFVFSMSVLLLATASAADLAAINGTWSGNWTPKGGVPDAVTVELRRDAAGNLTGKFLTPAPMDFSKASFNRTTGTVTCEAKDEKSGKQYKLEGKLKGTELIGTLGADDTVGEVRLIKWTFFGR